MTSVRAVALALVTVLFCTAASSGDYGTAQLIATWSDGTKTRDPASTYGACQAAAEAWLRGFALPLTAPGAATSARCVRMDPISAGFKPGWDRIKGYNVR